MSAIADPHLFLDSGGCLRGAEAGLAALLELALLAAELDRLSLPQSDLPAYIRASTLAGNQTADHVRQKLYSAATQHSLALERLLAHGSSDLRDRGGLSHPSRTSCDADARAHLDRHPTDIEAQLQLLHKATEDDVLLSRIRDSTVQEKEREGLWKTNERQRRDQNAINLAVHQTIHPAKPPPDPVVLPNLNAVHDELRYVPAKAPVVAPAIGPGRRPKAVRSTAAHSHCGVEEPALERTLPGTANDSPAMFPPAPTPGGANVGKRRRSDHSARPAKLRRIDRVQVPSMIEEQEEFDLRHLDGSDSDSDSDRELPMTLSRPKPDGRKGATVALQEQTEGGHAKALPQAVLPVLNTEVSTSLRSAFVESGSDGHHSVGDAKGVGITRRPPPRPRPRNPERPAPSGISTAF